jgi:hypothetical protein
MPNGAPREPWPGSVQFGIQVGVGAVAIRATLISTDLREMDHRTLGLRRSGMSAGEAGERRWRVTHGPPPRG